MRFPVLFPALGLGAVMSASAANPLLDHLVAYWNYEGNGNNNTAATGGAAFNGTLQANASTTGTSKVGTGALLLDGDADYMDVTTMAGVDPNQPWSVSTWFRPAVAYAGTARGFVYESTDAAAAAYTMSFGLREGTPATSTSFQLYSDFAAPGGDVNQAYQVDDAAAINTWHHIVSVFTPPTADTAGSVTGYLDGQQRYTLVIPIGSVMAPLAGFHVGTFRSANGRWFQGSIDETAIWNRGLNAAEIGDVYQRGVEGTSISADIGGVVVDVSGTPAGYGVVTGAGIYDTGSPVAIAATANPGYIFTSWGGSFSGKPASFTYTATANVSATATFAQDTSDPDGDGISTYDEVVVYHTLPNNADTDGDGIPDKAELDETGTNPLVSDSALVGFVLNTMSPNAAGTIAMSPGPLVRNPGTGALTLKLSLFGSATGSNLQQINLGSAPASVTPSGSSWLVTVPAPSNTVNSYVLKHSKP